MTLAVGGMFKRIVTHSSTSHATLYHVKIRPSMVVRDGMLSGQFIKQLKCQSGKSGTIRESTQASGVRKARVTRTCSTMYEKAPFYYPELA